MVVFDKFIATIDFPCDRDRIILRNDYLTLATYVNSIAKCLISGSIDRIYTVTEPRGDVLVWEPNKWSESRYLKVKFINYLQLHCL